MLSGFVGAVARKALFHALESEKDYVSPVASGEVLLNSRAVPIETGRMFASATLRELATLDERDVERRFGKFEGDRSDAGDHR